MNKNLIQWVGITLLVAIASGLLGWFIFISKKQGEVDMTIEGRGFTTGIPTGGEVGSMRENFVTFFTDSFSDYRTDEETSANGTSTPEEPRFWQVSQIPGTGLASLVKIASGTPSTVLRFVERPSGNVFEVPAGGGSPPRLTNTLIPRVYEALWLDADSLVIRHADDDGITMLTFVADIQSASSSEDVGELVGAYLEDDIRAVATHPTGKEPALFYLATNAQGTFGIRAKGNGTDPKRLWSSPLRGWRLSWLTDATVVLSQNAAQGLAGSAYTLSLKDGSLSLLAGNESGLIVTKHPTENAFAYSTSVRVKTRLFVRIGSETTELPIATFAEKCVWGAGAKLLLYCAVPDSFPDIDLPDAWYRGETSFNDRWYVVDAAAGSAEEMLGRQETKGARVDVVDPVLDADGERIFFTDGKTGTLWVVRI